MNRKTNTLILGTLLTGLGAGWSSPASAQAVQVRDLRILVLDQETRQVLGSVAPGGTYTLEEGQQVRLRMEAELGGQRSARYPSTRFYDEPRNNTISVLKTDAAVGNMLIQANGDRNRARDGANTETIRWEVVETDYSMPRDLRSGSITLRVREPRLGGGNGNNLPGNQRRDIVDALYQGILLREPDASGARSLSQNLRQGGYNSLVESARAMAVSTESRNLDRRDGASGEERLRALYDNLLGLSSANVDRDVWARDLRSIRNGGISDVVEEMVRSERFRDRFDVTQISRYDRYR
jgi:hypothetical protein